MLLQETLVTLREKRDAATSLLAEERERMVTIQVMAYPDGGEGEPAIEIAKQLTWCILDVY